MSASFLDACSVRAADSAAAHDDAASVTLFVGNFKKGPIIAHFDGSAGKGLPDFCEISKEIEDDQLVIRV